MVIKVSDKRKSAAKKADVKETSPADPGNKPVEYKSIPKLWNYTRYFYNQNEKLWAAIQQLQDENNTLRASIAKEA